MGALQRGRREPLRQSQGLPPYGVRIMGRKGKGVPYNSLPLLHGCKLAGWGHAGSKSIAATLW
jgi:hypothetical protein